MDRTRQPPALKRAVRKRMIQVIGLILLYSGLLFFTSGDLGWPAAWVYLAIWLVSFIVNMRLMSPETIAARSEFIGEATRPWDKIIMVVTTLSSLLMLPVAGLDRRLGWSEVPPALSIVSIFGVILSTALWSWAMASNPYFATTVRIQTERDHSVSSSGPYRLVRHPGYVGFVINGFCLAMMLGSWWALVPGIISSVLIVIRTALEDQTLQAELPDYRDYASRVRYRLLPGVW